MRRLWSLSIVVALISPAIPASAFSPPPGGHARQQGPQQFGDVNGVVRTAKGDPVPNQKVRVRDSQSGAIIAETTSNAAGGFNIAGLGPGTYVLEAVNGGGQVIGLSPSVAVTAGVLATTTITLTGSRIAGAAAGGGFSLFGLGTAASIAVIAAAGAASVTGIVVATHDASPSK